jgi:hypothetical protein
MNQQLLYKFQELESKRMQLQTRLETKPKEELYFKINPESWSIIQVLHHVMMAEKLAVDYMSKKINGINTSPKTNFKTSIRFFLLMIALKSPLKFKAPKALPPPPEKEELGNIINQWDVSRNAFHEFLKNFPTEYENKEIFKNLVAGKLNIHQALGWMNDHYSHHLQQIERICAGYKHK